MAGATRANREKTVAGRPRCVARRRGWRGATDELLRVAVATGAGRAGPARSVARSAPRVGARVRPAGRGASTLGASTASGDGASTALDGAGTAVGRRAGRIAAATWRAFARARPRFCATSARASAGRRFARGRRIARM